MQSPSPVRARRPGRPALHVEETKVRLSVGAKQRIAAQVGKQRMAAFIREAVEEKLLREEGQAAREDAERASDAPQGGVGGNS